MKYSADLITRPQVKIGIAIGFLLAMMAMPQLGAGQSVDDRDELIKNAATNFTFIATTLKRFQRTGQIDYALGLDGSEYEDFFRLLEQAYNDFRRGFHPESPMCQFYQDPDNGRMEIEERAILAFGSLGSLEARIDRYLDVNKDFELSLVDDFGGARLRRVQSLAQDIVSNEYLPTWNLDASEKIHFADTACTQ